MEKMKKLNHSILFSLEFKVLCLLFMKLKKTLSHYQHNTLKKFILNMILIKKVVLNQ